jgi:hypothetical protein
MSILDRLPFVRKPPAPPAQPQTRLGLLRESVFNLPYVRPIQAFWHDLQAIEGLWPLVLPLLAWVGWRAYQTERRKIRVEKDVASP